MTKFLEVLLTGLVGAIIGGVGTFLTLRFNYRQLFAETVSASRNNWLNEMRSFISGMLAAVYIGDEDKKKSTYYINRNQILTRLNMAEPYHIMLNGLIRELDEVICTGNKDKIDSLQNDIINMSQKLLKIEWNRVKTEAKGGK